MPPGPDADPATLQPNIPKQMRDAANLVSSQTGSFLGDSQENLRKRLNTVPPNRTVSAVRELLKLDLTPRQKIEQLVELADDEGLEAPPPPPRIDLVHEAQVQLVAWMAVTPGRVS